MKYKSTCIDNCASISRARAPPCVAPRRGAALFVHLSASYSVTRLHHALYPYRYQPSSHSNNTMRCYRVCAILVFISSTRKVAFRSKVIRVVKTFRYECNIIIFNFTTPWIHESLINYRTKGARRALFEGSFVMRLSLPVLFIIFV